MVERGDIKRRPGMLASASDALPRGLYQHKDLVFPAQKVPIINTL